MRSTSTPCVVVVTGIHHPGPIEIYERRPTLTGLGNFIWSDVQAPLSADAYEHSRAQLAKAFDQPRIFERLATISAACGAELSTSPDPARGTIVASVGL